MYPERIPELNQDSLSLNDNTVIQYYNKLDYSDEFNESGSSHEHSLSQSQCIELKKITEIHHIHDQTQHQKQQFQARNKPQALRGAVRPIKDIESKYNLGISPSTKEEQSILNANVPIPRKSYQQKHIAISKTPKIYSDSHGSSNQSEPKDEDWQAENEEQQQSYKSSKESGRQARLSQHRKPHFNIDSFLNAQPVLPKSKKGISVLNIISKQQRDNKSSKHKVQAIKSESIKQDQTINLMTIPEIQIEQAQKLLKNIKNAQNELNTMKTCYDRRLKEARLSFFDTMMPSPLKIKNNPYNLLKYTIKSYH